MKHKLVQLIHLRNIGLIIVDWLRRMPAERYLHWIALCRKAGISVIIIAAFASQPACPARLNDTVGQAWGQAKGEGVSTGVKNGPTPLSPGQDKTVPSCQLLVLSKRKTTALRPLAFEDRQDITTRLEDNGLSIEAFRGIANAVFDLVRRIHDRDYDAIIISGRSGVLSQLLFTEAWKRLYPFENMPVIYLLDDETNRIIYKEEAEKGGMAEVYTISQKEDALKKAIGDKSGLILNWLKKGRVLFLDDVMSRGRKYLLLYRFFNRAKFDTVYYGFFARYPDTGWFAQHEYLMIGTSDEAVGNAILNLRNRIATLDKYLDGNTILKGYLVDGSVEKTKQAINVSLEAIRDSIRSADIDRSRPRLKRRDVQTVEKWDEKVLEVGITIEGRSDLFTIEAKDAADFAKNLQKILTPMHFGVAVRAISEKRVSVKRGFRYGFQNQPSVTTIVFSIDNPREVKEALITILKSDEPHEIETVSGPNLRLPRESI